VLKSILFLTAILCFTVVVVMYTNLSFIDWPYLVGGLLFLALGILFRARKK
jgi:hypothetical protein|tara:strand:+ start:239 stop:391 length:153 start_codon:yes stop_codon:yes gene_type:complete